MRKTFTTLLLAFLALAITAEAQITLTPYKAKEQVTAAATEAQKTLTDVSLLGCATILGTLPGFQIPITVTFNNTNGEATAWLYIFGKTSDLSQKKMIAVGKMGLLGNIAMALPDSLFAKLPAIEPTVVDTSKWKINSDAMITNILANSTYKTYMSANSTAALKSIIMAKTPVSTAVYGNTPAWQLLFKGDTGLGLICMVNMETGATTCVNETGVEDFTSAELIIYPNPAKDNAVISIPDAMLSADGKISVFDLSGKKVYDYPSATQMSSKVEIPLSMLFNGKYLITYTALGKTISIPLTVTR